MQDSAIPCSAIPLVEVTRGALVESVHRGCIAITAASGQGRVDLGATETVSFYRSAAKPFQALPLVTSGAADHYQFTSAELAVINGSHSGETVHRAAVESILDKIGCTSADLQCGAHLPFDEAATKALRASGQPPDVLHNNCSGKHAGMLALAKFQGHTLHDYLAPTHPIQQQIAATIAEFAVVPRSEIGIAVDGCSAPVFAVPLAAMARSYANLVWRAQQQDHAAQRIVAAFLAHPVMIGGSRKRLDTDLMNVLAGQVIAKVGAEGVQLLGVLPSARFPHGLGIAIKIEDGDIKRARDPVVIETLRQLDLLNETQRAQLARYTSAPVYNHRQLLVGEVRAAFTLPL